MEVFIQDVFLCVTLFFTCVFHGFYGAPCSTYTPFSNAEWFSLATDRGPALVTISDRWTRFTQPLAGSPKVQDECVDQVTLEPGDLINTTLLMRRNSSCYYCLKMWRRNTNIIQERRGGCLKAQEFDATASQCDVSLGDSQEAYLLNTLFRSRPVGSSASCPWSGHFHFKYETRGDQPCDSINNTLRSCSPDSYRDSNVFSMTMSGCPLNSQGNGFSSVKMYQYQCMGNWNIKNIESGTVMTLSAVADLEETNPERRFKCLMTDSQQQFGYGIDKWAMSQNATCAQLTSLDNAPVKMEIRRFGIPNENSIPPSFTEHPEDIAVLDAFQSSIQMVCTAQGNPSPNMEFRYASTRNSVPRAVSFNSRYAQAGGRLLIIRPSSQDAGVYQCVASNSHGTVLSPPASLVMGSLGEFSNVPPQQIVADKGARLPCPSISGYPDIRYSWYKDTPQNFIKPQLRHNAFISSNGDLFFSEVRTEDQGDYFCVAELDFKGGKHIGGTTRTALPTRLVVTPSRGVPFGPKFDNNFIQLSPPLPYEGQRNVSLECFAYGTEPLEYTWIRFSLDGSKLLNLPDSYGLRNNNKSLELRNVTKDAAGLYVCQVTSEVTGVTVTRSRQVRVAARLELHSGISGYRVETEGDRLEWDCHGGKATVGLLETIWYKDGVVVQQGRTLVIDSLNITRDNGLYQCEVKGEHGTKVTTARLTVQQAGIACGRDSIDRGSCSDSMGYCTREFYTSSQEIRHYKRYMSCLVNMDRSNCDGPDTTRWYQLQEDIRNVMEMMDGPVTDGSRAVGVSTVAIVTSIFSFNYLL